VNRWTTYTNAIVEERTGRFIGLAADKTQADWIARNHNDDVGVVSRTQNLEGLNLYVGGNQ
jgi:hypothetical protein